MTSSPFVCSLSTVVSNFVEAWNVARKNQYLRQGLKKTNRNQRPFRLEEPRRSSRLDIDDIHVKVCGRVSSHKLNRTPPAQSIAQGVPCCAVCFVRPCGKGTSPPASGSGPDSISGTTAAGASSSPGTLQNVSRLVKVTFFTCRVEGCLLQALTMYLEGCCCRLPKKTGPICRGDNKYIVGLKETPSLPPERGGEREFISQCLAPVSLIEVWFLFIHRSINQLVYTHQASSRPKYDALEHRIR